MNNKILIIGGDPNSINSEIIFKSWKKLNKNLKKRIFIVSNFNLIQNQFKKLDYKIKVSEVEDLNKKNNFDLKILNIDLKFKDPFKVPKKEASKFVINSLNLAHRLGLRKDVIGIINGPINKKLLKNPKIGVTEFLAIRGNIKDNSEVMLIKCKSFAVCPLTTHIDVKDIAKKINIKLITNKIKTIYFWYRKYLDKNPKIGILGLNPHNAEFRNKSEEVTIITPSIKRLKQAKIKIAGPLVSDTIFIDQYKKYDVIVGMYHDQVLSPFKALLNLMPLMLL